MAAKHPDVEPAPETTDSFTVSAPLGDETAQMLPMPHVEGVTHRYVQTDDKCRIHLAEAGSGPPLIFIHGWPQHWYAWRHVTTMLAKSYRIICPDIRGLGWSEGAGNDWSLKRLAADVASIMDALQIERAGIVGHDWGAAIAYRFALDQPHRITRLMPLAGLHPWTSIGLHPRAVWRPWHVYTAAALGHPNNTWMQIPRISLHTWRHVGAFTPVETEIYCSSMRQPQTVRATALYYGNVIRHEVPHFIRNAKRTQLSTPILHLNGADDPLTQRLSDGYRDHAPNMRLEHLACGHFLAEERPEELIDHISTFFGDPQ